MNYESYIIELNDMIIESGHDVVSNIILIIYDTQFRNPDINIRHIY